LRKVEYSLKKKVEIKLPKNGNRRLRGHNWRVPLELICFKGHEGQFICKI
jgi:hypothetical protein